MLYLTTGANGSCKTLLTLPLVRDLQVKEGRPVCTNGRFELLRDDFGWKVIDAQKWQDEPDGTIFLFDECHNDFPVRGKGDVPGYVAALAEHRRRGFDFFLITQHPMNIDAFVRRLIGTPGWHRHLKRSPVGDLVSVVTWSAVNTQCEKAGSGSSGEVKMVPMPKEVYSWYRSASLHTAKPRIPKAVYVLGGAVVLVPALVWLAWSKLAAWGERAQARTSVTAAGPAGAASSARVAGGRPVVRTVRDWVAEHRARVEGLAYTAPRYDAITAPVRAPVIVGCWSQGGDGWCISQQGTRLDVPAQVRDAFIQRGHFLDFDPGPGVGESGARESGSPAPSLRLPGEPKRGPQSGA